MSVADLLNKNPHLELNAKNRIVCNLTGHEMPPEAKSILAHIEGKKYKKALEWYSHDYSKYEPYIVSHKSDDKKLFCLLTKQPLNKIPKEVENHFNGKRFQKLKITFDSEKEAKDKKEALKKEKERKKKEAEAEAEEDPDCWVPDFPISDDEDEEEDAANEEAEDDNEENNLDSEEDDEEAEEKPQKSNKKRKHFKVVKLEDDDEFIIRKKIVKSKKTNGKK